MKVMGGRPPGILGRPREFCPPMDCNTAWAILEFGRDLEEEPEAVGEWTGLPAGGG